MHTLIISGNALTLESVNYFLDHDTVNCELSTDARATVLKAHEIFLKQADNRVIYGVNTGFGPMASHILGKDQILELQRNLVVSHAVGFGSPIDSRFVLAAMLVRLNTLARGLSGVSPELLDQLIACINARILPIIPEHGAVGTSGDLVQLAHIALMLIGEGNVVYHGKRMSTREAFTAAGITPYVLKPKEGLSLINGTSAMSGISSVLLSEAQRLISIAVRTSAFALELIHGFSDAISPELHAARPHAGQVRVAQTIRELLADSQLLRDRKMFQSHVTVDSDVKEIHETVQDIYSFRCSPQILGPVLDTWRHTKATVELEINSVTDNPIVHLETEQLLHGGNFHGDYIANAIDQLKIVLVKMSMLSERRINFYFHKAINKTFPPFLNIQKPGLTLAMQAFQFVATSTTSQNQTFAFPQYVHSIPTNADNQDVVSMGTDAALLTSRVIENCYTVLAIEMLALAQALDFTKEYDKMSDSSKLVYDGVRSVFPTIHEDRVMVDEIPKLLEYIKSANSLIIPELTSAD